MTDPEPGSERWNWLAEGNARQARKRVSVDALIWSEDGKILLVEPTYKEGWDLPGGMAEVNEAPHQTVKRELMEELGLELVPGRLLSLDWVAPHGPWDDLITMTFDGGVLEVAEASALRVRDSELASCEFALPADAKGRLPARTAQRLERCLRALKEGATFHEETRL